MNTQRPIPVDKEVVWDKTRTIMSRTDAKGTIDYTNQVFVDVCGYSEQELLGQPHNIIRHPDMPQIIFKILWENIQKGINFHAVVKNLAKSGEYYWVITDFDIIRDASGQIISYLARRTALPTPMINEVVAPLYKKLLEAEKIGGMQASEQYLNLFLKENNFRDYIDFIENLLLKYNK